MISSYSYTINISSIFEGSTLMIYSAVSIYLHDLIASKFKASSLMNFAGVIIMMAFYPKINQFLNLYSL